MSRASKGFADFFPTAPSVLQQKRSRAAQHRKRQQSPPVENIDSTSRGSGITASEVTEVIADDGDLDHGPHLNGTACEEAMSDFTPVVHDEGDFAHGDLLNGVGSASSSSTTSSIFSTNHRTLGIANHGGVHQSTTLTPLTNTDSSPPGIHKSPSHNKLDSFINIGMGTSARTPDSNHRAPTPEALTPISSPRPDRSQARPAKGDVKGIKAVYDPELDKKLTSKERKGRKVQYKVFGEEVQLLSDLLIC